MNLTEHTRYLGRSLTLTTSEGRVQQVDHHESMPGRAMFSATSQPTERDDVRIQFDDGNETSIAVLGRGFRPKPGQRITAINATTKRGASVPLLYCFNHATRKGWLNGAAMQLVRRRAPHQLVIWFLPLLMLFGAWMAPTTTRADVASWIGQRSAIAPTPTSSAPETQYAPLKDIWEHITTTILPPDPSISRASAARGLTRTSATFLLDGWRDRNWLAFTALAVVVMTGCTLIGRIVIVMPATWRFRRRVKRLAKQHRRATEDA